MPLAHAGNDGADIFVVEDETQRHFRHGQAVAKERLERIGVRDAGLQIFRDEIGIAPVSLRPFAIQRECAGKRAFIERDARDYRDVLFAARGKELVLRILIENVVNHLNGVRDALAHGTNAIPGVPAVHADADSANFAAFAKFFNGARETRIVEPTVLPGMKLDEVERFDADILQALAQVFLDVIRRIGFVERKFAAAGPAAVFRRNLGRSVKFLAWIFAQDLSEQLLAVAISVSPGGVGEIAAEINRALQRIERFRILRAGPSGHAPHSITNFTYFPAGAAKAAIVH